MLLGFGLILPGTTVERIAWLIDVLDQCRQSQKEGLVEGVHPPWCLARVREFRRCKPYDFMERVLFGHAWKLRWGYHTEVTGILRTICGRIEDEGSNPMLRIPGE